MSLREWIRCFVRGHRWFTIIIEPGGPINTQRCLRCGKFRLHRLSDHERVKGMT